MQCLNLFSCEWIESKSIISSFLLGGGLASRLFGGSGFWLRLLGSSWFFSGRLGIFVVLIVIIISILLCLLVGLLGLGFLGGRLLGGSLLCSDCGEEGEEDENHEEELVEEVHFQNYYSWTTCTHVYTIAHSQISVTPSRTAKQINSSPSSSTTFFPIRPSTHATVNCIIIAGFTLLVDCFRSDVSQRRTLDALFETKATFDKLNAFIFTLMKAETFLFQSLCSSTAESFFGLHFHAACCNWSSECTLHIQQMRLFVGKLAIAAYLITMAYMHSQDQILNNTFRQAVELNIANLEVHERTKEFLRRYLANAIFFTFFASVIVVISRNILPKVVTSVGLALWTYFSLPPNIPLQLILLKITEEVCLIGGLLFIAGSEYIEASFRFDSPPPDWKKDQQKKEE